MDKKSRRDVLCIFCDSIFYYKENCSSFGGKWPMLLDCGHTVCEGCIKSRSRCKGFIICSICSTQSPTENFRTADELHRRFSLNLYAVGQCIQHGRKTVKHKDAVIGFYPKKTNAVIAVCKQCKTEAANCSCRQCNVIFCGNCFNQVHSVALKSHEKIPLIKGQSGFDFATCQEHQNEIFHQYCNDCNTYCCKECILKDHTTHQRMDILDKNAEVLRDFTEAYDEVCSVLKQLYFAQKKLGGCGEDEALHRMEREVKQHYNYLHGLLQLQEQQVLQQIHSTEQQTKTSITTALVEVDKNINELETTLAKCQTFAEEKYLTCVKLTEVLDVLKHLSNTPCHVVLNGADDSDIRFSVDAATVDMLKEHCSVSLPLKKCYELRSKSDLPDNFNVENIKDFNLPDRSLALTVFKPSSQPVSNLRSTSVQPQIQNRSPTASNLPTVEPKTKGNSGNYTNNFQDVVQRCRKQLKTPLKSSDAVSVASSSDGVIDNIRSVPLLAEGDVETVVICHFTKPESFYVHRVKCLDQLADLQKQINKQHNMLKNKYPPSNIETGRMYLVQYGQDKKWYRAIVKKKDKRSCKVHYIDYGNTEDVSTNELREIPDKFMKIPMQATHCSLFMCISMANSLNDDAIAVISRMCNDFKLQMYVERIHPASGLHEVDIRFLTDENSSFSDALIFLGYASKIESSAKEEGLFKQQALPKKHPFFKSITIKKYDTLEGLVTHINTPKNFYVQQITEGSEFLLEISKCYSDLKSDKNMLIYTPTVGMPIAVKYSDDLWYRATVLQIPAPRQLFVQYVDYGNTDTVDWTNIRKLLPKFLKVGALGLRCELSDVAAKNPKGWTVKAKDAFQEMVGSKTLKVYVEEVKESMLSVILYESTETKEVNVNGLLVKKGHAKSTGPSSAQHEYNRTPMIRSAPPPAESSRFSLSSVPQLKSTPLEHKTTSFSSVQQLNSQQTSDDGSIGETIKVEINLAKKHKVKLLKLCSPDEIYVTGVNLHKEIKRLTTSMTEFYNGTEEEDKEWAQGDICAVCKDSSWYRGVVTEELPNLYKVYIKDIAESVRVTKSHLRTLDSEFKSCRDGSVKCRLSGIKPPAGLPSWPASAIDVLESYVSNSPDDLYVTELGKAVNGVLPILLWTRSERVHGPFDPITEDWTDMSKTLIDSGRALPDHSVEHGSSLLSDEEEEESAPSKNFLAEWLTSQFNEAQAQASTLPKLYSEYEKMERPKANIIELDSEDHEKTVLKSVPDYPPPEPLESLSFVAVPSYVDYDCNIYLQNCEKSNNILSQIETTLNHLLHGTPAKPHDKIWSVGDICSAFYEPVNRWYRAKVLEVTEANVKVKFIDYGNEEELFPDQLRRQVPMKTTPAQCHKCVIRGLQPISPDGKWPISTLDFVHLLIVDQKCPVRLSPPATNDGFYEILYLGTPGGEDLIDILVQSYASYTVDNSQMIKPTDELEEIIPESTTYEYLTPKFFESVTEPVKNSPLLRDKSKVIPETKSKINMFDSIRLDMFKDMKAEYKKLIIPDSVVECNVEVLSVFQVKGLKINIVESEDEELISQRLKFLDLQENILQKEAEKMPIITEPYKGQACLGRFKDDNNWYRAIVDDVSDGRVMVYYVDYGNFEEITTDRLRNIKAEWMEVPEQSLLVHLPVTEGKFYNATTCLAALHACFHQPLYTMTIEKRQPNLEVEMYDCVTGELAYQPLLTSALLAKYE